MPFVNVTLLGILLLVSFISNSATTNTFPRGCEVSGFGFNESYLVVNDHGLQSFYLIQNHSPSLIELKRFETRTDVFMSPPLTAKIDSGKWAAFASDIENQHFQCFIRENNTSAKVDCRDVLDVCRYPRVKFALSNMGNYWVTVNKTQSEVINETASKGILLRW